MRKHYFPWFKLNLFSYLYIYAYILMPKMELCTHFIHTIIEPIFEKGAQQNIKQQTHFYPLFDFVGGSKKKNLSSHFIYIRYFQSFSQPAHYISPRFVRIYILWFAVNIMFIARIIFYLCIARLEFL